MPRIRKSPFLKQYASTPQDIIEDHLETIKRLRKELHAIKLTLETLMYALENKPNPLHIAYLIKLSKEKIAELRCDRYIKKQKDKQKELSDRVNESLKS